MASALNMGIEYCIGLEYSSGKAYYVIEFMNLCCSNSITALSGQDGELSYMIQTQMIKRGVATASHCQPTGCDEYVGDF